jgi:PAS domain S-box-containing protein
MDRHKSTNDELSLLAFDEAPIGLVLTEYRVITSCNKTFATMFGYAKHELLGNSFRMLYATTEEFDQIRDIGIPHLKSSGTYLNERIVQRRDGSKFWCRFRAHTLTPEEPLKRTILSYALISETVAAFSLTTRERQVAMHLSRGETSKEIARQLNLSPRTIDDVRARLLKKLKVRNTTELLSQLVGMG